jgi:hypothetical protein
MDGLPQHVKSASIENRWRRVPREDGVKDDVKSIVLAALGDIFEHTGTAEA